MTKTRTSILSFIYVFKEKNLLMSNPETKKQYSLFTAVSMIVGIVIGSGIFFKSDDILSYTGGNVMLGVLVFVIAAISIIFGSLSIAQLATRNNEAGGVISYAEMTWSKELSGSIGWFHAIVYYPTIGVVVSWVAGVYICMLFGFDSTLEMQCLIGAIAVMIIYLINVYSKKLGDIIQVSSTIIKLIPLFLIAVLGMLKGDTANITTATVIEGASSAGFIAAIVPIAFAYDGWIIATSISHEIKDAKKTLPIALIASPVFILVIYAMYLCGISAIIGPEQVVALGDAHVDLAATILFGASGAKIILIFIIISVLGTVNGIVLGSIRLPYSLAMRGMFPNATEVSKVDEKLDVPVKSAKISFIVAMVWYVIHYMTMKFNLLSGSDVSEISIVMNYVCYLALYFGVMKLYKQGEIKSFISGIFNPIMATVGSLIIFAGSALIIGEGSLAINTKSLSFMTVSFAVLLISYFYCKKKV